MLNMGDRTYARYTPQVIASLHAAYDRHFCDHLRSTEDNCRINCVHRTDVVRLLAISGISVVNWSHKWDQKYRSYELFALTCDNLSQPFASYRNPRVTPGGGGGHSTSQLDRGVPLGGSKPDPVILRSAHEKDTQSYYTLLKTFKCIPC